MGSVGRSLAFLLLLAAQSGQVETSEEDLLRQWQAAVDKGGDAAGLALLKATVEREPRNVAARFQLATAYHRKQDYNACIAEVRSAEKLDAVDERVLGILWVCLNASDRKQEALASAQRAVARYPRSSEWRHWYGISLLAHHQEREARAQFQQALRIDPEDATALYLLAQLYRSGGYAVPSLLAYLRFLAVEPGGDRARQVREQIKALLTAKAPAQDTPLDEGDFGAAQRVLYAGAAPPTTKSLEKILDAVLQALPPPVSAPQDTFFLRTLVPYFLAMRDLKLTAGAARLALDEPGLEATNFLEWSAVYRWER